jgi:hypothetical protein
MRRRSQRIHKAAEADVEKYLNSDATLMMVPGRAATCPCEKTDDVMTAWIQDGKVKTVPPKAALRRAPTTPAMYTPQRAC